MLPALLGQPLVLVPFHQLWPTLVETDKKLRVDKLWKGVLPDCKASAEKTCRSLQPKFPRRMCFKKTLDILIKWFGRENLVLNCQRARSIKHWPESLEAPVHSLWQRNVHMCSSNWLRYTNTQYPAEQIYSTRLFKRQFCKLCAHNPSCTSSCLAMRSKVQRSCVCYKLQQAEHRGGVCMPRLQFRHGHKAKPGGLWGSEVASTPCICPHTTNWSRLMSYSITLSGLSKVFQPKNSKKEQHVIRNISWSLCSLS